MIPTQIAERPALVPLTIEWSDDLLDRDEDSIRLTLSGVEAPFSQVSVRPTNHTTNGPIRFRVLSERWPASFAEYELVFREGKVDYVRTTSGEQTLIIGKRQYDLSDYFQKEPPIIRFHDGSFLIYDNLFTPPTAQPLLYDRNQIEAWDWTGVDLRKESQGKEKRPDSIQRRVIESLLTATGQERFDVIFDDDQSGEAADVIAIRIDEGRLQFRLYHCKFSGTSTAGARVDDLYAVCGQAQSSVHWRRRPEQLLDHLVHREAKRIAKGGVSRFERGNLKLIKQLKRRLRSLRPDFQICIVQPGLSQSDAGADHLELLGATELHLRETYNVPLTVIANA